MREKRKRKNERERREERRGRMRECVLNLKKQVCYQK